MFLVPLTRQSRDIARSLDRLFDDRFFDSVFSAPASTAARSPALDVTESEQAYTVKMEMPGIAKEDVNIAIDGRRVSIEASASKTEEQKDGDRVIWRERATQGYSRSFTLPVELDQAGSAAKMDNGVLTLTLAKRGVVPTSRLTVN